MLKFHPSVVSNNPIHKPTGAVLRLKTKPTSHYVVLSQLTKCLLLHASNHQVMRGFRHETMQFWTYFIRILVVGSSKWIKKKNLGNLTVEALKMSYDENITSVEAVNKLNDRAQAKLNAGI